MNTRDSTVDDAARPDESLDRWRRRRELALAISEQMQPLVRRTAPADADAAAWEPAIDMETNRTIWLPKHLHDEYQRLRFSEEGEP